VSLQGKSHDKDVKQKKDKEKIKEDKNLDKKIEEHL